LKALYQQRVVHNYKNTLLNIFYPRIILRNTEKSVFIIVTVDGNVEVEERISKARHAFSYSGRHGSRVK